jgi:hypothetical protein
MRLYYMTSAKWAKVILRERRLKVSRFHESNDPFELMLLDDRKHIARRVTREVNKHFGSTTGMICFGAGWESPAMWAHYGDTHEGVCLGFDVEDTVVTRIQYTGRKISVALGPHLPTMGVSLALLQRLLTTKANDWSYEREYRTLVGLLFASPLAPVPATNDRRTGHYYVGFAPHVLLREIVIGHRCKWSCGDARRFVGKAPASVRICKARPAFGRFEMVEQKFVRPVTVRPRRKGP